VRGVVILVGLEQGAAPVHTLAVTVADRIESKGKVNSYQHTQRNCLSQVVRELSVDVSANVIGQRARSAC
jgi:phage protein D